MSNRNSAISAILLKVLLAGSLSVFALSSCGGRVPMDNPAASHGSKPTITLTPASSSIPSGTMTDIAWAVKDGTFCVLPDGSTSSAKDGTFKTQPIYTTAPISFVCTGPGGSTTATVIIKIGSGCVDSETGKAGTINLAMLPSRLTGVAPLSVFLDATGTTINTTATPAPKPFHDLEYQWNFGDANLSPPVGGTNTWNTGSWATSSSRNSATGPVSAHVYETPGTYYVSLTITDGANSVSNVCTPIVVQDPDIVFSGTNTICIAATSTPAIVTSSTPGDCPVGAITVVEPSFSAAITSYAKTGKRVLFRRGDTFTASTTANITENGPGTIGAFGSGALPVMTSANNAILQISNPKTPTIGDWRFMDLNLDGSLNKASYGVSFWGGMKQVTFLRLTIHDVGNGIQASDALLTYFNSNRNPGHLEWDQIAIVDSNIYHMIGGYGSYGIFLSGQRFSLQGTIVDDTTGGEHVVRLPYVFKGVISNNTFSNPAIAKAVIKLHGPIWSISTNSPTGVASNGYTEKVVISDNKLVATNNDWTVTVGPENAFTDERVRDVILERNWFKPGVGSQSHVIVMARDITIRNNLFDMTGGVSSSPIKITRWGSEPYPDNVSILNNTFYDASTRGEAQNVYIAPNITNTTVINNLAFAPNVTSPVMIFNQGKELIQSTNSTSAQMKTSPPFATSNPANPLDFLPPADSYGVNTGTTISVHSDLRRIKRGGSNAYDLGMFEQP